MFQLQSIITSMVTFLMSLKVGAKTIQTNKQKKSVESEESKVTNKGRCVTLNNFELLLKIKKEHTVYTRVQVDSSISQIEN